MNLRFADQIARFKNGLEHGSFIIQLSRGVGRWKHFSQSNVMRIHFTIAYKEMSRDMNYRKTSNISRTLVGNKIVDQSDVVGAAPVAAAPTTSSFST